MQIGQTVCIAPAPTCTKTVTVKTGDTCYTIWTANGLTQSEFEALNPGVNCNALQASGSWTCPLHILPEVSHVTSEVIC